MNKKELTAALTASAGGAGMITTAQVADFLGRGRTFTTEFLRGVDFFQESGVGRKGKLYFVGDIADRIISGKYSG